MSEKIKALREKLEEARSRVAEINSEHAGEYLDPASDHGIEWNKRNEEIDELERTIEQCEQREERLAELSKDTTAREASFQTRKPGRVRGEDIYDLTTVRNFSSSPDDEVREMQERALEAVERGDYAADSVSKDDAQAQAEKLLRTKDKSGALARRILQTGSPTYMRAFGKKLEGQPMEANEERALSTAGSGGGFAVPFTLDPTVIHTSNSSVNPYRAISRVVQVTGNNWHGVTSAGISVTTSEEASEVTEQNPAFAQPEATPERWTAFVPFSLEIGMDWGQLQTEITSQVQEAKDDKEAILFTTGLGHASKQPEGLLIGGTATVTTNGTATFAVGDIYKLEEELPPRYRPRASWIAKRKFYNQTRQFDTAGGAQLFANNLREGIGNNVPVSGQIRQPLLEYPAYECSAMPFLTTTGGTIATFGDFSRFLIVDRIGMDVEIIPQLFGENRRPTGQKGFFAVWRNTSKVLDPNGFRTLKAL